MEGLSIPECIPVLPFRNGVLLPGAIVRLRCSSPTSVRLVEQELWQKNKEKLPIIGVVPVREKSLDAEGQAPKLDDFQIPLGKLLHDPHNWHSRGVAARTLHVSRCSEMRNGRSGRVAYLIVLEGCCRFAVNNFNSRGPYERAVVTQLDGTSADLRQTSIDPGVQSLTSEYKASVRELLSLLEERDKKVGGIQAMLETAPIQRLVDILSASLAVSLEEKLDMLDAVDLRDRLIRGARLVQRHMESLRSPPKPMSGKTAKTGSLEAELRDSLGGAEGGEEEDDLAALEAKLHAAGMPPHVWKVAQRELRRLKKMTEQSAGFSSARQYVELMADLPWHMPEGGAEQDLHLAAATAKLEERHAGLAQVKKRIIEYMAVRKLKADASGPVLCFVGPPGVGKTSLASSIAASLGRKFVRIALGGVKDEADIRGHRRTYVGSMAGRIIEGIKRVGVSNPVMLLDELDKTGADARGDPAAALLEVLDPEQNGAFMDHYLSVPFDLSKVVFLATANRAQLIPVALLDRLEVIELPGYTPEEKLRISERHLIPRVLEENGISARHLHIPEHVVEVLIQRYTREAGVRNLSRHLAALARAAAVKVAEGKQGQHLTRPIPHSSALSGGCGEVEMAVEAVGLGVDQVASAMMECAPMMVDEARLEAVLGPPRFDGKEAAERVSTPGVATGLVWTAVGGEVQFVEASSMVGKGELHLTGQLGEVIKESAQIALSWVRSHTADLALNADNLMRERDLHIHFPAGAVPKDGPSAGVTLATVLVSLLTRRCVRSDTAMTGEMSLRGLVLPVGGIKEKILAAHRCGIRRVIIPHKNIKDLHEVPAAVLACMEILPTHKVEEVLQEAFEGGCPFNTPSKL